MHAQTTISGSIERTMSLVLLSNASYPLNNLVFKAVHVTSAGYVNFEEPSYKIV